LGWELGVNNALLLVEVAGGIVFGSLAFLADAAYLVSDVASLGIAVGALILPARPASTRHSFGFARAEVMAPRSAPCSCLSPVRGSCPKAWHA
jgi:cobalt-zinc-cadmium efflux system protein